MLPARQVARSTLPRAARSVPKPRCQTRLQSSNASSSSSGAQSGASTLGVGVASGFAGAALFYGIYSFTPAGRTASKINKAAKEAAQTYDAAAKKLQQNSPSADDAAGYIKQYVYAYVSWIPGGRAYVDKAFEDWDLIRKNHREEADELVSGTYKQLQELAKGGDLSLATASKALDIFTEFARKLADLSGDALGDILDNHPQAKEKLGGNVDTLKKLGEQYGPEAKKQVDDTWRQVKDIMSKGLTPESISKARSLIDDKVEQVRKLGDEAWQRGLEEAKPFLDKNPKVKELVEKNADALKQGNAKEVFDKAKEAVQSGDLGGLEKYVGDAANKAGSLGSSASTAASTAAAAAGLGNLDKYTKMIPDGDQILPKLKELSEVADKHKEEGEKLIKETLEELKKVLENKSEKAKKIAEDAKKDAK